MANKEIRMAESGVKRVSWRRVGICLLIIFAAIWLIYPLTLHVAVWYLARKEARDATASIMPQRLPNSAIADLKGGTEVSALGYNFAVPWKVSKRSDRGTLSMLTLGNGAEIAIDHIENSGLGPGLIAHSTPLQAAAFRSVFGSPALSSKYTWLEAELGSSPADVSFWRSRISNARALTLMTLKEGDIGKAKVVYSIAAGGMHGFQVGDPQQPVSPVWLRLFDANDREFWMILHRAPSGVGFTQEQINAMVASMRPVSQ
jgi:hypothetical protein